MTERFYLDNEVLIQTRSKRFFFYQLNAYYAFPINP
eukprot:COSAG06_NODE_209_length_20178_cov_4.309478_13_plen_36_part_00